MDGFPFGASFEPFDAEHFNDAGSSIPEPSPTPSSPVESQAVWRCAACDSEAFHWTADGWTCSVCKSCQFYNVREATRRDTDAGVWFFVPRREAGQDGEPSSDMPAGQNGREMPTGRPSTSGAFAGFPSPPPSSQGFGHEEAVESELPTEDPVVDPDEPGTNRRRRNRRRAQSHYVEPASSPSGNLQASVNNLVQTLQGALKSPAKPKSDEASWHSRMGPEKNVRYRTGAPPQPPAWRYNKDDLRSFVKWQRKLQVWKLQISSYMSSRDAALLLFTSLTGEAEEELEHCSLERINSKDGIEYIEEQLKVGLQTKAVYQKRKLMADYESLVRQPAESLRAFANRYRRAERALESVGVNVSGMYDEESRGNRLLERSRLSPDNQRLVLIGSAYNLGFIPISESLCMSFPEHKPPPPLFGRDGQPLQNRRDRPGFTAGSGSSASASSSPSSSGNYGGKAYGKTKGKPRQAFATEYAEPLEPVIEQEDEQDEQGGEHHPEAEPSDDLDDEDAEELLEDNPSEDLDLGSVAEVLTVTAKKLQSLTLGRKFSGPRSIAERKKTSTCSACGLPGHWAGDAECAKSGGKSQGKGKGTKSDHVHDKKVAQPKKVLFTVNHDDGSSTQHAASSHPSEPPSYFTFMTFHSDISPHNVLFDNQSLVGQIILDTACQRSCCGREWYDSHEQLLAQFRLRPRTISVSEAFQFGRGEPLRTKERVYMPSVVGGCKLLLGASIVDTGIPFLASSTMLEKLQTVIDLPAMCVHLRALQVTVPIQKVAGHLSICITDFPDDISKHVAWKDLSRDELWNPPDPEVISLETSGSQQLRFERTSPSLAPGHADSTTSSMARRLEEDDLDAHEGSPDYTSLDVPHGSSRLAQSPVAHSPRDSGTEGGRSAAVGSQDETIAGHGVMLASGLEEVRKRPRKLRSVPRMPHEDPLEPAKGSLGAKAFAKVFLAGAIILKQLSFGALPVHEQGQGQGQGYPASHSGIEGPGIFSNYFDSIFEGISTYPSDSTGGMGASGDPSHLERGGNGRDGLRRDRQPGGQLHLPAASDGPVAIEPKRHLLNDLPSGLKKMLIGKIRKACHAISCESDTYAALATKFRTGRTRVDILETFAGKGPISNAASSFGLIAAQPLDYNTGFDLATEEHQSACLSMLIHLKPLVLVQSLHCTPWLVMQENMNYNHRPAELIARRELERPIVEKAMTWCLTQHEQGRYYLIENPETSRLWEEPSVQRMLRDTHATVVTCHSGAYGATNSRGAMIKKTFKFASNHPDLVRNLQRKLSQEELQLCVPLEGKEVTLSQHYPPELVNEILRGIRQVARIRNPSRFSHSVLANYTLPSGDQETWKQLLTQAKEFLVNNNSQNAVLDASHQLHQDINQCVPWELSRVQISLQPILRRQPNLVPYTHRGHALKFVGQDDIELFSEDLSDVSFPRGRFRAPVEVGIFYFGFPREADTEQGIPGAEEAIRLSADESAVRNPTKETFLEDVTFPNTPGIDRSIKMAVSRMHRNLGHLPPGEMMKLLALNGIVSDSITKCLKSMKCGTCSRAKGPKAPNPASSTPHHLGQFADHLQMDIFYVRDATSRNYPILGIICEATHLHAAMRLESRQPSEVCRCFRLCWAQHFGYPLRLRTDADGAFFAEFQELMDEVGTHLDVIPAEAHHQIGVIERHNSTLRMLLERIVDSKPCMSSDDIDVAITSALYAKNSATWSSGRPPYIAAFGKIPRVGLDLISDPRGLVAGSTRPEAQQQAALMRCEAMKAIAEASASSTLRRALLRKTDAGSHLLEEPAPGSLLAYWRWTTRSHRKRGGYRMARYLGRDPDGSSYWLQSGTHTIKVAKNQVRNVFGYEEYVPTQEDLLSLRMAEDNLRRDEWEDERAPEDLQVPDHPQDIEDADLEFPLLDAPASAPQVPQTSAPQIEPTSPRAITLNQNISQTQNIFGGNVQGDPTPHTPSRRMRSRTPTATRSLRSHRQEVITDPYMTARRIEPQLEAQRGEQTASPEEERTGQAGAPKSGVRWLTPRRPAPDPSPQPAEPAEVIDVEAIASPSTPVLDSGADQVGEMVPATPPELREASPILPAKRPFDALTTARAEARLVTPQSFELYGYKSQHSQPLRSQRLHCWARLDLHTTEPQQTMSTGPAVSNIRWRRTLDAHTGDIIFEGPIKTSEDEGSEYHHLEKPRDTITELWYRGSRAPRTFSAYDDAIIQIEPGWDGSHEIPLPPSNVFYQIYASQLAKSVGDLTSRPSDSETDDPEHEMGRPGPTRQEQKAAEKELHYRDIMAQTDDYIAEFVKATQKEAASFTEWKSLRPVPPEEAKRILADPVLRRRVVTSRACYRDKNKNVPPLKAKCRVVARGNQDPDLRSLTRQAATPSRTSEMLLLSIYISGANHRAFRSRDVWHLWLGDATTAFLQGSQDPSERDGKLYLRAPRDPIIEKAKVFTSDLYEVTGNVYGLSNAPSTWASEVTKRLEGMGFHCHSFDRMLFIFPDPGNPPYPCALLVVYVDDFLITYNDRFPFNTFLNAFKWGAQESVEFDKDYTFKGKEIRVEREGDTAVLKITQKAFINGLTAGTVSSRNRKEQPIQGADWSEFRSVSGCLQWLSGQCRLDISAAVSLSNRGSETTYSDLDCLYEALSHVKNTSSQGLALYPVPIDESTVVIGFSDASWANAKQSTSQHGQLILLAPSTVTEHVSLGALVDWKSGRSKRVCRSTLAAEAVSADTAVDRIAHLQYMLGELVYGVPAHRVGQRLQTILATDCKSLFDCVSSPNPNLDDKRSLVNVRSIQEFVNARNIHWVPTELMRADGLTKVSKDLRAQLLEWLQKPLIQLRESSAHRQAKKKFGSEK